MKRYIPNLLTVSRILLLPVLLWAFLSGKGTFIPWVLFALLAVTDFLDGYLARRWKVQSKLGEFLDPVADKLLVCMMLILISADKASVLFTVPALIIVARELIVSMLREFTARLNTKVLAVDYVGKYKSAAQMLSIAILLWPTHVQAMEPCGVVVLHVATLLTLVSLVLYVRKLMGFLALRHRHGM